MRGQSVACILFQKEKIFLIKRRDIPVWALPGGAIEKGETAEKAACREMEEESGYKVIIKRKVAEYIPINRLSRFTHLYEMEVVGGNLLSSTDESVEAGFFSIDQLPPLFPDPYRSWIEDARQKKSCLLRKEMKEVNYQLLLSYFIKYPIYTIRFLITKIGIHFNHRSTK